MLILVVIIRQDVLHHNIISYFAPVLVQPAGSVHTSTPTMQSKCPRVRQYVGCPKDHNLAILGTPKVHPD
ncbi:hypothetical protein SCP_0302960 [Sparassis crispa]|uniref:Uncharacterized protein n=1 Tax=Sparassis crispa TaxID=139825 RepID=A0A401GEL2_9APHY|nr:hypothetical protein SCP_0302960 [Sparassis crispa]GBE80581.1 hypothetical protein SCP_0302960 [Sparassis crispa]